jgi:hypothetical protein
MVKKLLIFLAFVAFTILSIMYLAPKENIYYALENQFKKFDIINSNEKIKDTGFKLELSDSELSFKSISSVNIKLMDIKIFAFYNSVILRDITLSQAVDSFVPVKIKEIKITYSIINPLNITIYEIGDNGEARGSFSLTDMKLHMVFKPSKLMLRRYANSLREFKKSVDGDYIYDKSF